MATTKKAGPVIGQKDVPPAIPKAAKPVTLVAKPVAPKVAAKKVLAKAVPKAAAKAPTLAKPVAAVVAAPAKAKAPAKKKAAPAAKPIAPEQRANYIEVAAFYLAERRGFAPGNPEQDYLDAAAEIDRLIAAGHFAK